MTDDSEPLEPWPKIPGWITPLLVLTGITMVGLWVWWLAT